MSEIASAITGGCNHGFRSSFRELWFQHVFSENYCSRGEGANLPWSVSSGAVGLTFCACIYFNMGNVTRGPYVWVITSGFVVWTLNGPALTWTPTSQTWFMYWSRDKFSRWALRHFHVFITFTKPWQVREVFHRTHPLWIVCNYFVLVVVSFSLRRDVGEHGEPRASVVVFHFRGKGRGQKRKTRFFSHSSQHRYLPTSDLRLSSLKIQSSTSGPEVIKQMKIGVVYTNWVPSLAT